MTDLPTLEMHGVGFKFFLWDLIEQEYRESGGRPDRVPIFTLAWSADDLSRMMTRRLTAFSNGTTSSINDLICAEITLDVHRLMAELANGSPRDIDVHRLMAELANGSPRDMIRMTSRIVAEQTRTTDEAPCIGREALWLGIRHFSEERAGELFPHYLADLRRIGSRGQVTFTIPQLASDVFRITTQAARSRVQKWEQTGLVAQIGTLPNPGSRPMHLYGAVDPRLAIAMLQTASPEEIIGNFLLLCPNCGHLNITDREDIICTKCNTDFTLGEARSLLEASARN